MISSGFARKDMLPALPPPASEVGILGWLRANLFSNWYNVLLTTISVLAIVAVLVEILPWAYRSTWTASSLNECRDIIAERFGSDVHGACWAVISERYLQIIYGFYPREEFWRPNLAFLLLFAAIAPVLFPNLPRSALWFTAAYPFLTFWLLWGGTVWLPVSVAVGFAIGERVLKIASKRFGATASGLCGLAATVIWWLLACGPAADMLHGLLPLGLQQVESRQFGGFLLSTTIGLTGIACSLPIGVLLALGRKSDMVFVKSLCVGFIEFFRGVPLITLLFVASTLLNIFMPPGTNFDLVLRVIIMVTLFSSAYIAEVVRGGLAALPRGQYEAADALGLDYWQSMRLIILPQALKISIPGIVSVFIGLFKDTTLVSIIGLLDPLGFTNAIRADSAWNGIVWELYVFVAIIFFAFCFAMSRYSMYLERKLHTGH